MDQSNSRMVSALATLALLLLIPPPGVCDDAPSQPANAGALEQRLLREGIPELVRAARRQGDARRGAVVFFQPSLACTKCHVAKGSLSGNPTSGESPVLGPDLAVWKKKPAEESLIEAVLLPSKKIREGYGSIVVVMKDGTSRSGLLVKETPAELVMRDVVRGGRLVSLPKKTIDEWSRAKKSIMPEGLANLLGTRQRFLDLARYLIEIAEGGPAKAQELQPPAALYAARPLPEYEKNVDHAGMIRELGPAHFKRGQAIYQRLCVNCHGTRDKPGSLPTSLRFASDKFKNGGDPFAMYQTLTHGFGMMAPQTWMVPQQKYDVVHYVRQEYLKRHNPSQHAAINDAYLAGLPQGNTRGPKPRKIEPWATMDYGPSLVHTYEIGGGGKNFAYKGIAARLDAGPGGVTRGGFWMVLDHDTLRAAAGWSGKGFIDFNGIQFNGRHQIHPRVVGDVHFANPTGPGWANPADGKFDDPRLRGRDGKPYGPLPREWARYKGLYHYGQRVIVSYTVGETDVLEMPGVAGLEEAGASQPVLTRTFQLGPRQKEMILQVAHDPRPGLQLMRLEANAASSVAVAPASSPDEPKQPATTSLRFDGATSLQASKAEDFDLTERDYTIAARVRTTKGGVIFSKTRPGEKWVPGGKTLFIRGGRLCFDIGWVGVVQTRRKIDDGQWRNVAMTWTHKNGGVQLFIDGKPAAEGRLKPEEKVSGHVVRLGFAAPDFPRPRSFFSGDMAEVRFYQRAMTEQEIARLSLDGATKEKDEALTAAWRLNQASGGAIPDDSGRGHTAVVRRGEPTTKTQGGALLAGVSPSLPGCQWLYEGNNLRLRIPAGEKPLRFTLWNSRAPQGADARHAARAIHIEGPPLDLEKLTKGGPPRWPQELKTQSTIGNDHGPFAVDTLTHPANNPWNCRLRFTGLDFHADGRRMAVCTWDGDVWLVQSNPKANLTWRRIATGLFQPLGLKIIDGRIHVSCRDQIAILHDLNGDGEIDFYENFNNDHQVTEHFHEFAMGLQTDSQGNFYYAKSARHALPALVPHHGTLLRVSRDGSKTDILATGFRAANGVCLNHDGTFFVTDQEGHWTPKNRINHVHQGRFYGNMYGYHGIKDSSNDAMEQPLCWLTNSFDRSPAELLRVKGGGWGPLEGSLLSLSYGYGQMFVVPYEKINGQMQGGACPLPLPRLPTGVMRGRFHPRDGQLYACGMFAWAGNQQAPGGLYRIRYTGKPVHLPLELKAKTKRIEIKFSGQIDPKSVKPEAFAIQTWSLRRTAGYGSKHHDQRRLAAAAVTLSRDGRTVSISLPDLKPTWCMEIKYTLRGKTGGAVTGTIHNTIHQLGEDG